MIPAIVTKHPFYAVACEGTTNEAQAKPRECSLIDEFFNTCGCAGPHGDKCLVAGLALLSCLVIDSVNEGTEDTPRDLNRHSHIDADRKSQLEPIREKYVIFHEYSQPPQPVRNNADYGERLIRARRNSVLPPAIAYPARLERLNIRRTSVHGPRSALLTSPQYEILTPVSAISPLYEEGPRRSSVIGQNESYEPYPGFRRKSTIAVDKNHVLKNWLFKHKDNPYPSSAEKLRMAAHCGLTLKQVSDFLTNGRRRYVRQRRLSEMKSIDVESLPHHQNLTSPPADNSPESLDSAESDKSQTPRLNYSQEVKTFLKKWLFEHVPTF
jgi:Homeobox KN domain